MYHTEEFAVLSQEDGLKLDCIEVIPDSNVKGIVQICHGMVEHKERYLDFMHFLAEHGYASIAHDHRGHGKSVESEEDWGYFYDDSGKSIVEDLNAASKHLRQEYPDVPFTLFGHSMGSLVVRSYLKKYDDQIDKLIVCGAVGYNPAAKAGIGLVDVMTLFKGKHYRSSFISNIATGKYDAAFEGEMKNRWISANEDNVKTYNSTPACSFTFTLNGFRNLFSLMDAAYSKKGWSMKNREIPILFIAGRDDPVILGEKKWRQAMEFLRKRGYRHVQGKLYDGMRHEILNETQHSMVYVDILRFLNEN